jgi:hypothetical protein
LPLGSATHRYRARPDDPTRYFPSAPLAVLTDVLAADEPDPEAGALALELAL